MANDTSSRDGSSRQQSGELAQSGAQTTQQGAGAGRSGIAATPQKGTSSHDTSAQVGRGSSGALQRRGSTSMSPYSSGFESGRGGGPFAMMRRISDEMDRLFENFGVGGGAWPTFDRGGWSDDAQAAQQAPSIWAPHIEVAERDGKLLVQADLPGIKREDIDVQIEADAILIQGHRQQERSANESGYYRSERSYGSFYRTIPLPEGTNADSASASFRDGVLRIELDAPRQQQRGRKLEIRDGS